ncbi:MAG: hypothetical protein KF726_01205 [Anaerolineae bacterium]|nr:hypothetical protein [Anaerolineae bacterium]
MIIAARTPTPAEQEFAARIRQRYPEGLTGIIAVGGTRTYYLLSQQDEEDDPGKISDFTPYAEVLLARYLDLAASFYVLGGQNLVMPILSYQLFYERGIEYAKAVSEQTLLLTQEPVLSFYRDQNIDPYFVGIDTLLSTPASEPGHQLALALGRFQREWKYVAGRRKLLWEVAPIPLYSIWNAPQTMTAQELADLQRSLDNAENMDQMYRLLYAFYARAVYGTDLPIPHFYLGTNRNGPLKLRSLLPIALLCGGPFRLFYTPYPSAFTTSETLRAIFDDLAFNSGLDTTKMDYRGQVTAELLNSERARVLALRDDPTTTLGFLRKSIPSDPSADE